MSDYFAIAEYESLSAAKVGIDVLEKSHFTEEEVSLVTGAADNAMDELNQLPDVPDDRTAKGRGVGLGTLIGGAAATPVAIGTMVGPFMVAGPLLGLAVGAAAGSLFEGAESESLRNLSADYESRVKAGSVLVFIAVNSRVRLDDAVNALVTTGPRSLERIEP